MLVNIIVWIIFGAIVGWVANRIMRGGGQGIVANIVLGIIGSFVGGWLFNLLDLRIVGGMGHFIAAVVGAMVLIFVVGLINKR